MEDHAIIELYWQRQENAIGETAQKIRCLSRKSVLEHPAQPF